MIRLCFIWTLMFHLVSCTEQDSITCDASDISPSRGNTVQGMNTGYHFNSQDVASSKVTVPKGRHVSLLFTLKTADGKLPAKAKYACTKDGGAFQQELTTLICDYSRSPGGVVVEIVTTNEDDSGHYACTCTVESGEKAIKAAFDLTVSESEPRFQVIETWSGKSVSFSCTEVVQQVTWFKDSEPVASSCQEDPTENIFCTGDTTVSDSGNYSCKIGQKTIKIVQLEVKSVQLEVKSKSSLPLMKIILGSVGGFVLVVIILLTVICCRRHFLKVAPSMKATERQTETGAKTEPTLGKGPEKTETAITPPQETDPENGEPTSAVPDSQEPTKKIKFIIDGLAMEFLDTMNDPRPTSEAKESTA
eukprot:m.13427 g.13427  ORF g.13427 m.13427 type:complete len:362 (+) comp24785_c0_seq2:177-1262(+)